MFRLKFGLSIPITIGEKWKQSLVTAVKKIDDLDFDSILVWDHYMMPKGNRTLDAWNLLAYIAGITSRVRLGTVVTPIPFRPPAILAKMISSVDQLSDGRVIFGVGAGWHAPEFRGYSTWESDSIRVEKTIEGLEIITKLWTEDSVTHEGKYYQLKDAVLDPKPIQKPYPPLWFGTASKKMLGVMAKYGNGWIPVGISPQRYGEIANEILSASKSKSDKVVLAYFSRWIDVGEKKMAEEVEAFAKAGCEYFVPVLWYESTKAVEQMEQFAKNVMPSYI